MVDSKRQNRMMLSKTPPTRRPTQQSTNQLTPRYQKQVVGKEHTLGLGGWGWGKGAALGWMGMGLWAALWMPPALCGMDGPGEPPVQRGEMSASGSLGGPRPLEETLDISSTLIVRIDLRLKADGATALLTAGGLRTHAQRPQLRAPNPSQFPVQKEAILPGFKSAPAT